MKEIRVTFDGNKISDGGFIRGDGCVCRDYKTYILTNGKEVEVDPETVSMRVLEYVGDFNGVPTYKRLY